MGLFKTLDKLLTHMLDKIALGIAAAKPSHPKNIAGHMGHATVATPMIPPKTPLVVLVAGHVFSSFKL